MVESTQDMAKYCFAVIVSKLKNEPIPPVPENIPNDSCPIFVTLKTGGDDRLRGCIGNFASEPLHQQLKNYAIASAFEDSRFSPVRLEELHSMRCSVCLLHTFEKVNEWNDWVIGTHGIRIQYEGYGATFLPEVMPEQGWDHYETIHHLLRKAGFSGEVNPSLLKELKVTRYQSSKAAVAFSSTGIKI